MLAPIRNATIILVCSRTPASSCEAAEEMNRRALAGREKVLGKEHPDTLTSVSILAEVLQYQGQYEAAEEMNRRALAGREKLTR
jgi:Tfp pilus assembly protein PilF